MRRLLTLDAGDYTADMPVFECWNVRAVIFRDGKLAMQRSRLGEFKFPGGSVDEGESNLTALCREVREETGLLVRPASVRPLGEILEMREDLFQKGTKYVCHSLFYACEVEEKMVETAPTASELKQGQELCWETPSTIAQTNTAFSHKQWIARDTAFLRLWMKEQGLTVPAAPAL